MKLNFRREGFLPDHGLGSMGKSCAGGKEALEAAWQKYPSLLLASAVLSLPSPHQEPQKDAHGQTLGYGSKEVTGSIRSKY